MGILRSHAPMLREIADKLKLESVGKLAQRPGVNVILRVAVRYFDGRARDSVSTLYRMTLERCFLETVYLNAFENKPLVHQILLSRYDALVEALATVKFDQLHDQADIPDYPSVDLWLVERAAGTFQHGVLLAPMLATDAHNQLVNAIKNGLPEAVRQVD